MGDAQSTPEGGNAEVEKMNSAACARSSALCSDLSRRPKPRRLDLPYIVDVGVTDAIVTRG